MSELKEKTFGEKFKVECYQYPDPTKKPVKILKPIEDEQMIKSLNYLRPYICRGVFPKIEDEKNFEPLEEDNFGTLGLYSYIADRQEFDGIDGPFFYGFVSLKQYHHLYAYEVYYNPEDKIKLYVYTTVINMKTQASKYKVKPNKALSFAPPNC